MTYKFEIENAKFHLAECQKALHKRNRTPRQVKRYTNLVQHWTEIIMFNRFRLVHL